MSIDVDVVIVGATASRRVRIQGEDDHPVDALQTELERLVDGSGTIYVDANRIPDGACLRDLSLVDGSSIGVGRPVDPARGVVSAPLELRIVGGPGAGLSYPLASGRFVVGRGSDATIILPDEEVSRRHAELVVAGDEVSIVDAGSTNGTWVEGARLKDREQRTIVVGDLMKVGSSMLELAWPTIDPLPTIAANGMLGINRRFRGAAPTWPTRVEFPRPEGEREKPALNLLLTIAPAVLMAGIAVVTGRLEFLLFCAVSPIIGLGRAISQRRSLSRATKRQSAKYRDELAAAQARLAGARRTERTGRRTAAPDLSELALNARQPGRRLWERQPDDEDFLEVRVGTAALPSTVEAVGGGDGGAVPELWGIPVTIRLGDIGNLSLVGPQVRTRGVAAGIVLQLAIRESPSSVKIVVIADEQSAAAWEWASWLPHCKWSPDETFRLMGSDPASTRARLAELLALIKHRREQQERNRRTSMTLPAVVVVLDDASAALGTGFAHVLNEGPDVGIHVLCLDATQVPGQCRASVRVPVASPDTAIVDHHGRAPVSDVTIDLPSLELCDLLARSIAPLVALGEQGGGADIPNDLRLLDLVGATHLSGSDVVRLWADGPTPSATVGVGVEGPVSLDLTQHGPHGLVAGTTRSGKSEFLKTFVAAFALSNHPDDLSFLFVDFKGGADYRLLARLPHAVDLSTSEDLADFERTTRLLDAEIGRRRRLFDTAQTTTIEGYSTARGSRPDLAPVGRLVVIVDEFAELVSKAPSQLERLVSVARTGAAFGVHLILATQRPAGNVTGQIEANVALRVCFRVSRADESLDVLDAPDAADIAQRHRGRAFFRAHSEPLQQFQSARVGGARPGSTGDRLDLATSLRLWTEIGRVPAVAPRLEAPDPDTDLFDVVEACAAAAALTGWIHQAVPWPRPLPTRVGLSSLPRPEQSDLIAFAVADDARAQRQRAVGLSLSGGHVGIAGASGTGRTTALRSLACGLAERLSAADAHVYLFDFAGGVLRPLAELPHCGGSAVDDWEQAGRLLRELAQMVSERLDHFAERGFASIADQRSEEADPLPYLIVLVDGWDVIVEEGSRAGIPEQLLQVLGRGLAVGVRGVVCGDRTIALGRMGRLLAERYVLRFNDDTDYASLGIRHRDIPVEQPLGGAFLTSSLETAQIAEVDLDGHDSASAAIRALAARIRARDGELGARLPRRVEPLPRRITLDELRKRGGAPSGSSRLVPIGVGGERAQSVYVELSDLAGSLVVAGPSGSGRTTALRAMAQYLLDEGASIALIAPRASALLELGSHAGVTAVLEGSSARWIEPAGLDGAHVVLIDDVELLALEFDPHVDLMSRGAGPSVIAAGDLGAILDGNRGWMALLKQARTGVVLSPRSRYDGELVGGRLPDEFVFSGPPGRGVTGLGGRLQVVQMPFA